MTIEMIKFGPLLISRPAGKDAWLGIQARLRGLPPQEEIVLDFHGVTVLTPSWMDEFLTPMKETFTKVSFRNIDSQVIEETLTFLESLSKPS